VDQRLDFEPHRCFACGSLNAHGLHLELHVDRDRCWTDVAIPDRFQGWNDIAHGGIVSTILDEVMAWSLVDHDVWGVTARLAVDFKRPVPLLHPVHAEGWVVESRRRVFRTAGRLLDGQVGTELATAEATYVAAPDERKRELKRQYGYGGPASAGR
jgi:acyl-coenzyme A thioesterase PaaI-like protein